MRIKNIKFFVLCFLLSYNMMQGQQESQFTQYMYNTMSMNPGYTGTTGVMTMFGIYRAQWVGLDGAPRTMAFSAHSPIGKKGNGIGLSIISDEIGPSKETYVDANYAYNVPLSYNVNLSLGLRAGMNFLNIDYDKLNKFDPGDSQLEGTLSRTAPTIGAGAYVYSDKWYVGLSVPSILETKYYDDIEQSVASSRMHIYMMGGYVFDLDDQLKFKPAVLLKAVNGAPLSLDVSANFLFQEKLTLGMAYRLNAAVSTLAAFSISDALQIGYAYDHDMNNLSRYNSGSHEIFLRYDLFDLSKKKIQAPRFF
ncbi:type IX secretion system membrane protein PorP/SprF [Flavobacterium sp. '19STA2R22 D10 B1']|uniref:PorP/SprF family type IX secretion system membrane protein n=1 Tax=Flavobacterium aerium TaxID=3037261 RepID=UPI00278C5452|nr:type IX secretion system membrane protein PorP/SprF [Flavobacterium sp. '19STA2R22 D10 B1']